MISAQKFAANLRGFSRLDDLARAMFAETASYVLHQFHAHGNKDPHIKLMAADLPGWVKDGFKKLTLGKRDKTMTPDTAEKRGDALAATVFASQEEKRAIAKANREARAERKATKEAEQASTQEPEATEPAAPVPAFALIGPNGTIEIDADEYQAIVQALLELRAGDMSAHSNVEVLPALKAA